MSGLFSLESWSTVWTHRESFLLGLGNTLQTAVCALALGFIIGAELGLMSTSGSKLLRIIARIYVEFVQNTPLLLQLCFLYYALAFAGVSLGVIRTGIIALGVYTGAYMGEVVRAAIESVPKGQFEAAQAQGFHYLQRMGYIILPQSIPVMLPPMVNQVVNLFKNTSCLYIVGGADLIRLGNRQVNARAYVARFNFSGADQEKKCGMLSGGERNRLHLALALKEEGNVLLLDEPTNDIDVNTLRALEEGLENFAGCAVVISHDRWFLDRIATHILSFEGDSKVVFYEGSYSEYEEWKKAQGGDTQPHRVRYKKLMA